MDKAMEFRKVSRRVGKQTLLAEVDLDVPAGRAFGLAGVNGAGKTTLIKGMLDLAHIDSGSIRIFGIDHRQTASRADLAFLPEQFMPPYYLKGRDFLGHMARLYGKPFAPNTVEGVFARLDLDLAALDKPVRAFSKGMTQKLGLAACVLSEKPLLVLDEPMSGLDARARARLKELLLELKNAGRTLFFTSHVLADVDELCDDMAIVHRGKLRFAGSPAVCRERFNGETLERAFLTCVDQSEQET